ncbi:MAG: cellulase family glycosylhydrolase [Pyrinomonadaceae bacterium]
MNPARSAPLLILVLCLSALSVFAQNDMNYFITRDGDKLLENGREYRFVSFNIPNLHLVEDNMEFEKTNEWRFPDEYEITDALESIKRMGGRVARTYVISICRKDQPNPIPCHVRRPGEFNEEAFRALDKVLEVANRVGVRVIIPFVDNWKWWGGREDYAAWRGKTADDFWTDREIIEDYKKTVRYVLNRKNTLTGKLYKDDTAVLAWETGNELFSTPSWTKEAAALIKAEDKNHLVWDGLYIGQKELQEEILNDPNIDIVSSHHYPDQFNADGMAGNIKKWKARISGRKVYVVGEFGFIPLKEVEAVLDAVIGSGASGALIWSLRYHNRDGGFYHHAEGSGGGLYKAYHYPGFASADEYEERALIELMRKKAFEIRGLKVSPPEKPSAPSLLPIESPARISWRGSAGASGYNVERAADRKGPWEIVGMNIDDSLYGYRPLFSDRYAEIGREYFYRVVALGAAGESSPSNVIGPVKVKEGFLVDEMSDGSRIFALDEDLRFVSKEPRPYKEDASRLKGAAGDWLIYRASGPIRSAEILTFMEGEEVDFEFYLSADGRNFVRTGAKSSRYPTEVNPYGYKLPVKYELTDDSGKMRFLKIVFKTDAQISRVEIRHGQ